IPGRVARRAGTRPRYSRTRCSKQRSVRNDFFLHSIRDVAPREAASLRHFGITRSHEQIEMIGRHDLPLGETGNVDDAAEPEVRVPLQMVNEILTREVFFRCRALDHILVTQVPMHIDLSRHDRFTSQVDVSRTCGHRNLALPSDRGELVILDNKVGRAAYLSTVRSRISYADGVKNSVDCPVFISIR